MPTDHRVPEARALRRLFDEQWRYLRGLLAAWAARRAARRGNDASLEAAIDTVADGTDPRIRCVGAYQSKLRGGVRGVLKHVDALVDGLPGAIAVNQQAFGSDPLVNALFVNKHEMKQIFSQSRDLRDYFAATGSLGLDEAYALLFLTKQEKTMLGAGMVGDMLVRDTQRTVVSFTGHRVFAPRPTEEAARRTLKETLFASIVDYVMARLARLRSAPAGETASGTATGRALYNPQVYLEVLTRILREPEALLTLQAGLLRIDRLGIVTDAEAPGSSELRLNEFSVGERPPRIVAIVKYPRAEMLDGFGRFTRLGGT